MAVPTLITDLSTTAASNSPSGSENVFPSLDDYLRAQAAFLASVRDNSGNGWVSPYLATTWPAAPGPIGATTPSTIAGTTGTFSGNVQMASLNGGQLAGLRNKIINGGMQIQQRGSVTVTNSSVYGTDRWLVAISGGTGITASNSIGGLGGPSGFGSYIAGTWTNGQPLWAQRIESRSTKDLINKAITVSGVINQPTGVNDTYTLQLSYADTADNFTATTLVANVATATITGGGNVSFSATFTAAQMNVGNIGNGIQVSIVKSTAVTHATTANYVLSCVQLEIGSVATPFEQRPIGMELALCQRYFFNNAVGGMGAYTANSLSWLLQNVPFPVQMRTTPGTITQPSGFTIQGVTSSATGFSYSATATYYSIVGAAANGVADGVCRRVDPNSNPSFSAEL